MVIKEYSPVVYNAFLIGINELCYFVFGKGTSENVTTSA